MKPRHQSRVLPEISGQIYAADIFSLRTDTEWARKSYENAGFRLMENRQEEVVIDGMKRTVVFYEIRNNCGSRLVFPDEDAVFCTSLLPVDVTEINAADRPLRIFLTYDELHHMTRQI